MVMLFPDTADRTPRFHTTSKAYGEFYGHSNCMTPTDNFRHSACERRIRECQRDLEDAKSCFDNIEWSKPGNANKWRLGPGPCCFELVTARPAVRSEMKPVTDKMECIPVKLEFLEDHVNYCHPRLAPKPKFLPKTLFGRSHRPVDQSRASTEVNSEEGFEVENATKRRPRSAQAGNGGQRAKTTKGHHPQKEFQPSQQYSSLHDPPAES